MKTEEETIKDCVDITTEYLREKRMRPFMPCDICSELIQHDSQARKWHLVRTLTGWTTTYHSDCMKRAMSQIWKEIFQAQELKRKKYYENKEIPIKIS